MKNNSKSNITYKQQSNNPFPEEKHWTDLFPDLCYTKQKPISDEYLEALGHMYYKTALKEPTMTVIYEFFSDLGICNKDIKSWRLKNETFDRYVSLGSEVIGARREKSGNNHNATMYSELVRDDYEWRAKIKSQAINVEVDTKKMAQDMAKGLEKVFGRRIPPISTQKLSTTLD